jgi:hypothetical protein
VNVKKNKWLKRTVIFCITGLVLTISAIVFIPEVQTFVAQKLLKLVVRQAKANVSVGRFEMHFFKNLHIDDLFISDQAGDTLIYAEKLHAGFDSLSFSRNYYVLDTLELVKPVVKITKSELSVYNYEFLLKLFGDPEVSDDSKPLHINAGQLIIKGGQFAYREYPLGADEPDDIFNSRNLLFNNLNVNLRNISYGDSLSFISENISFSEQCGFIVDSLTFIGSMASSRLKTEQFKLRTPYSVIHIPLFDFEMAFAVGKTNAETTTGMERGRISHSRISGRDMSYFSKLFKENYTDYYLSADLYKRSSRYITNNLSLTVGNTELRIDAEAFENTQSPDFYVIADITHFHTDKTLFTDIPFHAVLGDTVILPAELQAAEYLDMTGQVFYTSDSINFTALMSSNLLNARHNLTYVPYANTFFIKGSSEIEFTDDAVWPQTEGIGLQSIRSEYYMLFKAGKFHRGTVTGNFYKAAYQDFRFQKLQMQAILEPSSYSISMSADEEQYKFLADLDYFFASSEKRYDYSFKLDRFLFPSGGDSLICSGKIAGSLQGSIPDKLDGYMGATDLSFDKDNRNLSLSALVIKMSHEYGQQIFELDTEYGRLDFRTTSDLSQLLGYLQTYFSEFVPIQSETNKVTAVDSDMEGITNLTLDLKKMQELNSFFFPNYNLGSELYLEAYHNASEKAFELSCRIPEIQVYDNKLLDFDLEIFGNEQALSVTALSSGNLMSDELVLERIYFESRFEQNTATTVLSWYNNDSLMHAGDLSIYSSFADNENSILVRNSILPTRFILKGKAWDFVGKSIDYDAGAFVFDSVLIVSGTSEIEINGRLSSNPNDALMIDFYDLRLNNLDRYVSFEDFHLQGNFRGRIALYNSFVSPGFDIAASINSLKINDYDFGDLSVSAEHITSENRTFLNVFAFNGANRFSLEGYLDNYEIFDIQIGIPTFDMRILHDVFKDDLDIYGGTGSGNLQLFGDIQNPSFNAVLRADNLKTRIHYLGTEYQFSPVIALNDSSLNIFSTAVSDSYGNTGNVSAEIRHRKFDDFNFDVNMNFERFLVLNTAAGSNEDYSGRVFAGGKARIFGSFSDYKVDANIRTLPGTELLVNIQDEAVREEYGFVSFVGEKDPVADSTEKTSEITGDMELNMQLQLEPEAKFKVITDPATGDELSFRGSGLLGFKTGSGGNIELTGEYEISKGKYDFKIEDFLGYEFEVKEGSTIRWAGSPYDALTDIEAQYTLRRIDLYDLFRNEASKNIYVPVTCHIYIKDRLMQPEVSFGLSTNESQRTLSSVLKNMHRDELNKQFVSLLLFKKFQPMGGIRQQAADNAGSDFDPSALLAKQLGPLLSSINENVDVGLKYKRFDTRQTDEIELDVSAGLLDNRLQLSGNVAHGNYYNTPNSNTVGDFEIEFNLTPDGRYRMRVYNASNRNLIYHSAPYTQGVGFSFRSEFEKFFKFNNILRNKR